MLDAGDQPAALELREQLTLDPRPGSSKCHVNGPPQPRIGGGADHGDAGRPARTLRAGVRSVDAADRDDREVDRGADLAQPVEPDRGVGVVLRRRLPDRPDAEVVGVGLERLRERRRGPAEQEPRRSGGLGSRVPWPRWTPSAPSASAASTSSLTTNVTPARGSRGRAPRPPSVGAFTRS